MWFTAASWSVGDPSTQSIVAERRKSLVFSLPCLESANGFPLQLKYTKPRILPVP